MTGPAALLRTGALALLLVAGGACLRPLAAQVPAAARWQELESAHFRVTFTAGLEPLARHAAAAAERARQALVQHLAAAPAGKVDIILSDNVDFTNGSASPFPSNRVYLYAKPPVDVLELNYVHDWLELVLVHELAHTFHLDATSRLGAALRQVFGRVPMVWPMFPAIGSPAWSIEGLAVAAESGLTPMGRLHGTYHDMIARTAALEDRIDDIDRLSSTTPVWPGYQRVYVYGSLFFRHLEQQYGADAARRIVSATATAVIPPPLWYDRIGQRSLGVGFRTAYDAWRDTASRQYLALADTLRSLGVSSTVTLARDGGGAAYPRWSPDGRFIAYAHQDRRIESELRVIDALSGSRVWSRRRNTSAPAAWLPDGSLLTSDLEFTDRDHLYQRLLRLGPRGGPAGEIVLRGGLRVQDVDVSETGTRAIGVANGGGTNALVLVDPASGEAEPLTLAEPGVHWAEPRWSPRGDLIAVGRWSVGGRFDVVVLDTTGYIVEQVTHGIGVNTSPAWSPDARWLVFSSDRSGIANLYAYDRERQKLLQLSNVLTGAFQPDFAPDGRQVAFSAYHHDGFHIEVLPFDSSLLREPAPPRLPQLPIAQPGPRAGIDTATSVAASYGPARAAAPKWWAPVVLDGDAGTFLGAGTGGVDLVGRHAWDAWLAFSNGGRSAWGAAYEYRGWAPIAGTALQPSLRLLAGREWDRLTEPVATGEPYVDEREDVLSARTALLHRRFRSIASVGLGGELVSRRRLLFNAPGARLLDADDKLLGATASAFFSNTRSYPFSISAEDGVTGQLGLRRRWDQSATTRVTGEGDSLRLDGGERELSAWSAGYLALGRVAFANAVFAVRGSALLRDGPGASTQGVGGASGGSVAFGDVLGIGGGRFLPVRGFPAGARRGTQAWSASAELRVPVALLAFKPRPLPFYLDRLSATLFADAGGAACGTSDNCAPERLGATLVGLGGELSLSTSLLGGALLLRAGCGVPVSGGKGARWYLQAGPSF